MNASEPESSPATLALSEIERLRVAFRESVAAYVSRIEADFDAVCVKLTELSGREKIPHSKLRDLRDMLTLLRNTQVKTAKGRRKDIKKLDSVADDLRMLVENW
jgi:hypothetical protein